MLVMFSLSALYMPYHLVHRSWFAPVLLWGSSLGCRLYVALRRLTQAECVDHKCVCLLNRRLITAGNFGAAQLNLRKAGMYHMQHHFILAGSACHAL